MVRLARIRYRVPLATVALNCFVCESGDTRDMLGMTQVERQNERPSMCERYGAPVPEITNLR